MLRIFGSPHRYLQGPQALDRLGAEAAAYSRRVMVVADSVVLSLLRDRIDASLRGAGIEPHYAPFGGECTAAEIDRLTVHARDAGAELIVGAGGGKAIDAAKGVCIAIGARLVVLPTIASNDSPTSRLSILYDEQHVLREVRRMNVNPDVVLVDTAVILAAPERFFVSGIGDAISKKFESAQCFAAGGDNFYGARPPYVAELLAEACYDAIRNHAEGALEAIRARQTSEAFERTVEATILLSGLAFENGGLSISHAMTRGLSAVEETGRALHGEQVAFGLLVQLVLEKRPQAFVDDMIAFYRRVGLPTSLRHLGYEGDPAAVIPLMAEVSWARAAYVKNMVPPTSEAALAEAIATADRLGRR